MAQLVEVFFDIGELGNGVLVAVQERPPGLLLAVEQVENLLVGTGSMSSDEQLSASAEAPSRAPRPSAAESSSISCSRLLAFSSFWTRSGGTDCRLGKHPGQGWHGRAGSGGGGSASQLLQLVLKLLYLGFEVHPVVEAEDIRRLVRAD